MDESQLKELMPPVEENPLLKRKPLNLGTSFIPLAEPKESVEIESILINDHLTVLFFTASWCNISKSFIKSLHQFYNEVNLQSKKLEIIYVGFDKNKKQYQSFTKSMPWIGLPFADQRVSQLKQFYDIRSIPQLILLDSKGEEIKNSNRNDLYGDEADKVLEKWSKLKEKQDKDYYYQQPPQKEK